MSRIIVLLLALGAASALGGESRELHFKSPAPGMRFTAGLPVQVWADIIPRDDDHPGWPQCECRWDEQLVGERVNGNKKAYDYFPFTVPAERVTAGTHALKLNGFGVQGPTRPAEQILPVEVDPWPADKKQISLDADLKAADLDWTNVAVRGNGHSLTVSGKLTIKNSLITGLGSIKFLDPSNADPAGVEMVAGISGELNGDVVIEDSIFEATGALNLSIGGGGTVSIRNNEFRANNFIKFVPSNPEASPVIRISGKHEGPKQFQANRIAAGIVRFEGMQNWLIGGGRDIDSNIFMGPRCVLALAGCRTIVVSGNYIHHDYRGTWSQGFNFYCENSDAILAEHNVLRASSWPLQSFGGEFRYNLMIDSGHNWVRVLTSGTKFHHNLLVHTGDPYGTGMNAGIWLYGNHSKAVAIYNNTFDGGAPAAKDFDAPIIALSPGCNLSSLHHNVFTGVNAMSSLTRKAIIARNGGDKDNDPRIDDADYNCFFNPPAAKAAEYDVEIVSKKEFGAHDIHADPKFAEGRMIPYSISESDVWNRNFKVSEVLALYRKRYAPGEGSPLLNADGKKSFIGAIGKGDAAEDLFGRFSNETK